MINDYYLFEEKTKTHTQKDKQNKARTKRSYHENSVLLTSQHVVRYAYLKKVCPILGAFYLFRVRTSSVGYEFVHIFVSSYGRARVHMESRVNNLYIFISIWFWTLDNSKINICLLVSLCVWVCVYFESHLITASHLTFFEHFNIFWDLYLKNHQS